MPRMVKGRLNNYQLRLGREGCLVPLRSDVMLEGKTV